jgi:hypothetical protein
MARHQAVPAITTLCPMPNLPTFLISCGLALLILVFVVENFDLISGRMV